MRSVSAVATLALLLSAGALPGPAADERGKSDIESADALFKAGQLADAGKLYARVAAGDPKQYQAALRLGYLALLSNRFDEARKWLGKAADLRPREAGPRQFLAEVYYRLDEF